MTTIERKRLRELAVKATPGPWDNRCREFSNTARPRHIWSEYGWLTCDHGLISPMNSSVPDAEFMAVARTAVPQLLDLVEELERKPIEVKEAVECLVTALKADPGFYYSYQANIAMAFVDQFSTPYPDGFDLHKMANEAAKTFLDRLCK